MILPDERTPLTLTCMREATPSSPKMCRSLGTTHQENDACFVKSPGRSTKQEVAGEPLPWEPPTTRQRLSH